MLTSLAPAKSLALALQRFVSEPLELGRKRVNKGHLTLGHDQTCSIRLGRNPPLRACGAAPIELASRILMVVHGGLQQHCSCESVSPALQFAEIGKPDPHAIRQL